MTLSFDQAYAAFSVGDSIAVSDGTMRPAGEQALKNWKGRNFVGTLATKVAGPPRKMTIQMPPVNGATVSWQVVEGDGTVFDMGTGAMSAPAAQASALAAVDAARDAQRQIVMTPGPRGQGYVYAQKQREFDLWLNLGALNAAYDVLLAAFNLLSNGEQQRRFPFAMAEAAQTPGETVSTVFQRWAVGINSAKAKVAQIDAIAVKAKRDIKTASTSATKKTKASDAVAAMSAVS